MGVDCFAGSPRPALWVDVITLIGESPSEKIAIMGAVTARISVASTAEDTDFIVKSLDVYPGKNGPRDNVASGVTRMRWRNGGTSPEKTAAGTIHSVDVDMRAIGWVSAIGNRIGVQIQSSSWPEATIFDPFCSTENIIF